MKIAYLMQAGVPDIRQIPLSGPSNHVVRIIEEFKKHGHQVSLLAVFDQQIWITDDLQNYRKVSVRWLDRGVLRMVERILRRVQSELRLPYFAFFDSLRFAQACKQELKGFDIFYERLGWMGYGSGLASRSMNIPLILEVNGDHLTELRQLGMEPRGAQRKISIFLMKQAARRASHSVATGAGWKQQFMDRWGIESSQVSVVENGTEMVHLVQREQLRCFKEPFLPGEPVKVVYVGGFEPWHGLSVLIRASARVVDQGIPVKLILVGSGSLWKEIDDLIHTLHMQSSISLVGQLPMDQVAKILADADIGASPYCGRVEFSGLKLLDYKAAGLATIASGENGQPAVISHGQTGLIVPPCNEEELAEAISLLCSDNELRKKMGRQARKEAEEIHSWSSTASEIEKIMAQVLQ